MVSTRSVRTRCSLLLPLLATLAVACGGSTEPAQGPLKIGIVSGNNQTAAAGRAQLADPVVGQLVRLPNGTVAWRVLDRATDLLLPPKAYAQGTVVTGSPVPGAVVCAATVDPVVSLTPVVPCTNTATDGTAVFAFKPGTIAGQAKAVVQGMVNNVAVTFDTARATIKAGPPIGVGGFTKDTLVTVGQVLDFNTFPVRARDEYGNINTEYVFSYRRVNANSALTDPAAIVSKLVTVRTGDQQIRIWADAIEGTPVKLAVAP
jgi:hypothetical protein